MATETKRVFKWFWAWQDEAEEKWLREMAASGWHLESVPTFGRYAFVRGEPADVVYRLDFCTERKDYAGYLQLFHDAGWEHLGEFSSWQYFRMAAAADQDPDIYTDNASKASKYRRIMLALVPFFGLAPIILARLGRAHGLLFGIATMVGLVLTLVLIYGFFMLARRIRQLTRERE